MSNFWQNIFRHRKGSAQEVHEILSRIPLFSDLKIAQLKEIERIIHQRHYAPAEVMFWEGEPGVGMYIIQEGEVGIFQDYQTDHQQELTRLGQFDFFGEMALLDDQCRSATAVAMQNSHLLGIFHPDLFELFERNPRLGVLVLKRLADMLAARLRKTNQDLLEMGKSANTAKTSPD